CDDSQGSRATQRRRLQPEIGRQLSLCAGDCGSHYGGGMDLAEALESCIAARAIERRRVSRPKFNQTEVAGDRNRTNGFRRRNYGYGSPPAAEVREFERPTV